MGKEPEAAIGFLKLGKIPRKIRSNSRVCKKLIRMRGSNRGRTGRKSKEEVPGMEENQTWEVTEEEEHSGNVAF